MEPKHRSPNPEALVEDNDDEKFTMEDLEELQAAQKEKTKKKTKKFVSMVQQTAWVP